ncbi:hypothetical protein Y032_0442g1536 [Ancylostoma ceylanicum]|uniref:Hyaluronidase n=1 Tax=Ancylostoma ceylanicum TaxID=53326 RepID=A0A016WZC6_9BILA|nr:hypothetical protein Y032_0442g1536 [Ancylostoma ceylanicum]
MTGPYDDCNLYTTTNEVFQNESIKLATKKYSNESDPTRLKQLAEKDYNEAARDFFIKTIKKARDLRPHAKWGFYGFPYCNYDAGSKGEYRCKDNYQEWNDRCPGEYDVVPDKYDCECDIGYSGNNCSSTSSSSST